MTLLLAVALIVMGTRLYRLRTRVNVAEYLLGELQMANGGHHTYRSVVALALSQHAKDHAEVADVVKAHGKQLRDDHERLLRDVGELVHRVDVAEYLLEAINDGVNAAVYDMATATRRLDNISGRRESGEEPPKSLIGMGG